MRLVEKAVLTAGVAAAALITSFAFAASLGSGSRATVKQRGEVAAPNAVTSRHHQSVRPNVVLVLTDDMTLSDLDHMPRMRDYMTTHGTTFTRAISPYPLCCPARATLLTGQYPHNHHVMGNGAPAGGFEVFDDRAALPVRLHRAGYDTLMLGKYLNDYEFHPRYQPPGWTQWHVPVTGVYNYRDWTLNENGRRVTYSDAYQTDVWKTKAERLIGRYAPRPRPFFLWEGFVAPHNGWPADPDDGTSVLGPNVADRHRDAMIAVERPHPPSFNEPDGRDKPRFISRRPARPTSAMTELWQQRAESLRSVDEAFVSLINTLREAGELDRTVVIFTSDNGYLLGEHRWLGKAVPYEESIRVPLLISGPGFEPGATVRKQVSLVDLAPTILAAAGEPVRGHVDGAPLQRVADEPHYLAGRPILLEGGTNAMVASKSPVDSENRFYVGVRTSDDLVYIRYQTGKREFYDLRTDPFQLENRVRDPAAAQSVHRLARLLTRLENCAGSSCLTPRH